MEFFLKMTTDTSDDEFDISNANHNKMTEKMEKVSKNNLFSRCIGLLVNLQEKIDNKRISSSIVNVVSWNAWKMKSNKYVCSLFCFAQIMQ